MWVLVLLILFKAAAPLLASAAAGLQGRPLAEVCTVYGVATVALDATPEPRGADRRQPDDLHHQGDGCLLTAVGAMMATGTAGTEWSVQAPAEAAYDGLLSLPLRGPDASTRWAQRKWHGPPRLA